MGTKQTILLLFAALLVLLLASSAEAVYYYYGNAGFPYRYDYAARWTPRDFQNLALRNQYALYQIPAGTGYVFSPGYYAGPRYFPGTNYWGTRDLGPYGFYSQRNYAQPYGRSQPYGWWT